MRRTARRLPLCEPRSAIARHSARYTTECLDKLGGMHTPPGSHRWLRQGLGLDRRLNKMVAAGRLSKDEARRISAASPDEREQIARTIQVRHARARIDAAVADGRLSDQEAQVFFARLDRGEDLKFLRGLGRRRSAE